MNKLRAFISGSGVVRPALYRVLASPRLNRNRLYHVLYDRRIRSVQRAGRGFPRVVAIEGTNRCNAACLMCGHRRMLRPQGVMDWRLYEHLLSQLTGMPMETLLLSGFGEPLLDPLLVRRVEFAKRYGIKRVALVSNAALLTRPAAEALTESGLDLIHVSLDGGSARTYNRLRVNLDFDAVAANIDALLRMARRPAVHIQMVLFKDNRQDTSAIERRWGGKADRIIFRQAQDWAGQVDIPQTGYTPHTETRGSWPPCRYLWEHLNIYWDGTVPACCIDFEARLAIGNAEAQTMLDIWRGNALEELRRKHNTEERDTIELCRQCRYYSIWW